MTRASSGKKFRGYSPDMDETKEHVIAAGREILLAAHGALKFCRSYVDTSVSEASKPALLGFFEKAISVADELGHSMMTIEKIKKTADNIARPVFETIAAEMKACQNGPKTGRRGGSRARKRTRKVKGK